MPSNRLDLNLLQEVKRAFVPMPGGQPPPMDPAQMQGAGGMPPQGPPQGPMGGAPGGMPPGPAGGMPPGGAPGGMPPMDPSMMGGGQPGGMPPGGDPSMGAGAPPPDPNAAGGQPPPDASMVPPPVGQISLSPDEFIRILGAMQGGSAGKLSKNKPPTAGGGDASAPAQGGGDQSSQKLDQILQLLQGAMGGGQPQGGQPGM